jgi:hypothetical protein
VNERAGGQASTSPRSLVFARGARAFGLVLVMIAPAPALSQSCTLIAEGTRWLWHPDPQPAGWSSPGTQDDPELSGWRIGCTPFSNTGCGFAPGTYWEPYTTLLLRQHVFLSGDEAGMVAYIAIDNDFELWINGNLVSSLVHEGCATRWDAVVPIPAAYWTTGDNIVAARIIDRGGVTNFEMTLTGSTTGACPPGCAQLPCIEPGPVVVMADVLECAGRWVAVPSAGAWGRDCAGEIHYRFRDSRGTLLRGWDATPWIGVQAGGDVDGISVEARCSQSPTCPPGGTSATVASLAFPPQDPGPALRVNKAGGLAALSWGSAPALLPGEHDHVLLAGAPDEAFVRANGEADRSRSWLDPAAFGRACYVVRVADSCEIESTDP